MVALMAVSGSMFAQETTEPKGEVIDFVATFSKYEKDATDKSNNEFVYLEKNAIEQNGISVVLLRLVMLISLSSSLVVPLQVKAQVLMATQ